MKVAIIARSTFYTAPGGDTVQAIETARHLAEIGVHADIRLTNVPINYEDYDLLHFFNIIRPADISYHTKKSGKPFVVSTILCDYSEYDKNYRGAVFRYFTGDGIEYLKTIARWVLGKDHLSSLSYLWKGQRKSIKEILRRADMLLPNSESEYRRIIQKYPGDYKYTVVPNGVDPKRFKHDASVKKDDQLILCVARIEGIKNQLNLIKALNNTRFNLALIGSPATNQIGYYKRCRDAAAGNITFIDHLLQDELVKYYQKAKVHILPSWFETTGLSSVEAAVMGCNVVITDRGDAKEYFGQHAFYCDPEDPYSILAAIQNASVADVDKKLSQKILENYTWQQAAIQTHKAYQTVLYETKSSNIGYAGHTQPLWGI